MVADITIKDAGWSRTTEVADIEVEDLKGHLSMFDTLSMSAYFDSGIMPLEGSGVLSLRQCAGRTQIVFQHAPGIQYILWGARERDPNAKARYLAQPYRIVIIDHVDGELRGARHFYSPVPITHAEQPLYHCNVPNLNCKGYNGTSVGWICIYRTESYKDLNLAQKIHKSVERASGHEAYNDANMRGTDGTRFYKATFEGKKGLEFLYDPDAWEKKTQKQGWEWTLDADLWIPIKVQDMDHQNAHDPKGKPLTLEWAMMGNYMAYYPSRCPDETQLSLLNKVPRGLATAEEITELFNQAFLKATKEVAPKPKAKKAAAPAKKELEKQVQKQPDIEGIMGNLLTPADDIDAGVPAKNTKPCLHCASPVNTDEEHWVGNDKKTVMCDTCHDTHYLKTDCCDTFKFAGDLFLGPDEKVWCSDHHSQTICGNCGSEYIDDPDLVFEGGCVNCKEGKYCDNCGNKTTDVKNVVAAKPNEDGLLVNHTYVLCMDCFTQIKQCACGLLQPQDTVTQLPGTTENVCESCVKYNEAGAPVYVSIHT